MICQACTPIPLKMGDSDDDSNADEVGPDEASRDIIVRMKADLEKIDKALAKIQDGTYGIRMTAKARRFPKNA